MGRRRLDWTPEMMAEAMSMRSQGKTVRQISASLKEKHNIIVSHSTLYVWLRRGPMPQSSRLTKNFSLLKRDNKVIVRISVSVYTSQELDQLLLNLRSLNAFQIDSDQDLRKAREVLS